MKTMKSSEVIARLSEHKDRSAWSRAVTAYAVEIVEAMSADGAREISRACEADALNGARDWRQYSDGGCSLVYDAEIAERVCTPSELKRKRGGDLEPNSSETWLDVQASALAQAWRRVCKTIAMA